jgi:rhamnose transport system ATP-binding protein
VTEPLLDAVSISKSFAGVRALKQVSFDLRAGEVHALVGENGAGKSTLIKIMTGAETADAGTISVGGQPVRHLDPHVSRALGIAAIYQQPALFPDLTVAENIALTLERPLPRRGLAVTAGGTRPRSSAASARRSIPIGPLNR